MRSRTEPTPPKNIMNRIIEADLLPSNGATVELPFGTFSNSLPTMEFSSVERDPKASMQRNSKS